MNKDNMAQQIYVNLATKIATENDILTKEADKDGVKGWGCYNPTEIESQLKNAAKFAKTSANIFEETE